MRGVRERGERERGRESKYLQDIQEGAGKAFACDSRCG